VHKHFVCCKKFNYKPIAFVDILGERLVAKSNTSMVMVTTPAGVFTLHPQPRKSSCNLFQTHREFTCVWAKGHEIIISVRA